MRGFRRIALVLGATSLLLLVVGIVVTALDGSKKDFDRAVGWSNILAFVLAAAGAMLYLLDRKDPAAEVAGAVLEERAKALAELVRIAETRNLRQLIGGDDTAQVRFSDDRAVRNEGMFPRLRQLMRFGDASGRELGDLASVAEHFHSLPLPRMVVLGPPGAGKTVLLIALVLQTSRRGTDRTVVPVRADLSSYDRQAEGFTAWLASRISAHYRVPVDVARRLVETGRILPVLDGLDEMDADPERPDRAVATLRAIDSYVAGAELGVVVACREDEWSHIASASGGVPGASIIHIQPLTAGAIRRYIADRLGTGTVTWQPVVAELAAEPRGPLARALSRPLWLYLATLVHHDGPGEMLGVRDAGDLRKRLLAGFVPAASRTHPGHDGGGADRTEDVVRWLRTLARYLNDSQSGESEATDLVPDRLWQIAGVWRVRVLHATLFSLMVALLFLIGLPSFELFFRELSKGKDSFGPTVITSAAIVVGIWTTMTVVARRSVPPLAIGRPRLRRIRLRAFSARAALGALLRLCRSSLRDGSRVKWSVAGFIALVFTVAVMRDGNDAYLALVLAMLVLTATLYFAICALHLLLSLAIIVVVGPVAAIVDIAPRTPRRPYDSLRYDRTVGALLLLLWPLFLVPDVIGGRTPLEYLWSFVFTITIALSSSGAAVRYALALTVMSTTGRLPLRLKKFLTWGVEAGLLRESGTAYQFRHIELQRWLVEQPANGTPTRTAHDPAPADAPSTATTHRDYGG